MRDSASSDHATRFHFTSDDTGAVATARATPGLPALSPAEPGAAIATNRALFRACADRAVAGCTAAGCAESAVRDALASELAGMTQDLLRDPSSEVELGCAASPEEQHADCLPPDEQILRDVDSGYYFHTDLTGAPGTFAAAQHRGRALFAWADQSLCEKAFKFARKWTAAAAAGPGGGPDTATWMESAGFIDDLAVHGSGSCGGHIKPADHYDDLTSSADIYDDDDDRGSQARPLGMFHEYCVQATSAGDAGASDYSSTAACAQLEVVWESTIAGNVLAKGSSKPVAGVTIAWEIVGTALLKGTVVTDGAGYYEIHIKDTDKEITAKRAKATGSPDSPWHDVATVPVVLHVFKGDDPFLCQDVAIGAGGAAALCGGKDTHTGVMFPPVAEEADAVPAPGDEPAYANYDNRARFLLQATYMRFSHSQEDMRQTRIFHAPISPVDGTLYFAMQAHVFGAGDRTTTRVTPAARDSEFPHLPRQSKRCKIQTSKRAVAPAGDAVASGGTGDAGAKQAVCLKDYDRGGGTIKCVDTDVNGRYHFAAPQNTRVYVEVTYRSHSFRLDAGNIASDLVSATVLSGAGNRAGNEEPLTTHLLHVTADVSALTNVDFQDVTGQVVTLGTHGTKCRHHLADEAFFSVRAPASEYLCESNGDAVDVAVNVNAPTFGRVLLPGHVLDITLEDLAPAWPEVTDASDVGYFYRVRTRTRRRDYLTTSEERAKPSESDSGTAAPPVTPVEEYEYHPKPSLTVVFSPEDGTDRGAVDDAVGTCGEVTATDKDLESGRSLVGAAMPRWVIKKGTVVSAQVAVTEKLTDGRGGPLVEPACSWVEFDASRLVHVRHTNRLGLSHEDLAAWEMDKTTAEYKEFKNIVDKTLPNLGQGAANMLQTCSVEGADPNDCDDAAHTISDSDLLDYRDAFGDDVTCAVPSTTPPSTRPYCGAYADPEACAGFAEAQCHDLTDARVLTSLAERLREGCRVLCRQCLQEVVLPGYGPAPWDVDAEQATPCADAWADLATPGKQAGVHSYQAWHSRPYSSLNGVEKGLWTAVGVAVSSAYAGFGGGSYADFSRQVYMDASSPWDTLVQQQKEALVALEFTPETWGQLPGLHEESCRNTMPRFPFPHAA